VLEHFSMTDTDTATNPPATTERPSPEQSICARCKTPGPVGDDGFCDRCEGELEQACL
jgi:hypothetical protein